VAAPSQLPTRLTFGPFEVNFVTGELRKGATRIRLPAQPLAILLVLLKTPGELVTREQLRDEIWGDGTFVDFDHGLNAAVNKLRRALGDSADAPRYIETLPGRGYRFIGMTDPPQVLATAAIASSPEVVSPLPQSEVAEHRPARIRSLRLLERLLWVAIALACVRLGMQFQTPPPMTLFEGQLTRLTNEAGLSAYPALSPDGTLIAYSSDLGVTGEQDIYIRQIAGGQPVRLTFDGANNTAPDFSPDGTKIVFQSKRNGGGIFEMPALGGHPRLLARGGLRPKYSPDGSHVAYWVGAEGVNSAVPGSGSVWVVPVNGGAPRQIGSHFTAARKPIWLPDGKRLLFVGYTSSRAYENSGVDWWVAAIDGTSFVRTDLYRELVRTGFQPDLLTGGPGQSRIFLPPPGCWSGSTNTVVFSMGGEDQADLWEIGINPKTGKVTRSLRRLTVGTLNNSYASCTATGKVAFTSVDTKKDVWSLPFHPNRGAALGTLERITMGPSYREHASLAKNGRFVAFASNQSGVSNIWVRDLVSGRESPVAISSVAQHYPALNAAGDRVAYSAFEKDMRTIYVSVPGGVPEVVCKGCLRATDWSRDDRTLLVFSSNPYQIERLDIASRQRTLVVKHPNYHLLYGRFSPDDRWVSFTARTQPDRALIMIAPLNESNPIPESAWVKVSEATPGDWADWSPDGKTLYFTAARDGHSCLWGQRIDAVSGRPHGEPFAAMHLHGRVYYQPGTMWGGWSVANGRIAMLLAEDTGSIWTLSRARSR
jgi:Tol biopolymer transport system component/DNA-binding winged helix-turn-helix (wHTH) protein